MKFYLNMNNPVYWNSVTD